MRPGWMVFRWPTWSAAETASPEISRSPPGKPANQPSCKLSRLSSYSLCIVSGVCNMGGLQSEMAGDLSLTHGLASRAIFGAGRRTRRSARRLQAGLPVDDARVHRFRIGIGRQRGAEGVVGKHLGDFGQDFQMLLGDVVRDQQEKQQVDRLAVG